MKEKRQKEKNIIRLMIALYCKNKHQTEIDLCDKCRDLIQYAEQKIDLCPMMQSKTFCSKCKVHCYVPNMREEIKKVMHFSAPRMIFYQPMEVLKYLLH
ncbi:MAG: nitrous oxide-stimulated promoter family protein [Bacteroidales bacterium]